MLLFGILNGLGCAFCQSLSYLATRHYVQGRLAVANASRQLLVLSHLWMGLFSLFLLPMVWPAGGVPWSKFLSHLFANIFCYAAGQLFLATALKHAEASRVSPLMTSKLILSSILVILYGKLIGGPTNTVTPLQVFAVGLCIVAGVAVNFSGGRMKTKAILAVAAAACSFSLSDWSINLTIADLQSATIDRNQASMLTLAFTYLACGILAIPLLIPLGSRKKKDWIDSAPFALTWFFAMVGLFFAFSTVGLLLGSILQCTRSFITIIIAGLLMHRGHHHIEPLHARGVLPRRLAAGFLMFFGISLYILRVRDHPLPRRSVAQPIRTDHPPPRRTSPTRTSRVHKRIARHFLHFSRASRAARIYSGATYRRDRTMPFANKNDRWHLLLNSRYVCESCLTRFFIRHRRCPACHRFSSIKPLNPELSKTARSETQLRTLMSGSTPALSGKTPNAPG